MKASNKRLDSFYLDPSMVEKLNVRFGSLSESYIATEALEDDVVCGIEIAPSNSEGVETASTDPLTTDPSSSWSIATLSTLEEYEEGGDEEDDSDDVAPNKTSYFCEASLKNYSSGVCTPVYGRNKRRKWSRRGRSLHSKYKLGGNNVVDTSEKDASKTENGRKIQTTYSSRPVPCPQDNSDNTIFLDPVIEINAGSEECSPKTPRLSNVRPKVCPETLKGACQPNIVSIIPEDDEESNILETWSVVSGNLSTVSDATTFATLGAPPLATCETVTPILSEKILEKDTIAQKNQEKPEQKTAHPTETQIINLVEPNPYDDVCTRLASRNFSTICRMHLDSFDPIPFRLDSTPNLGNALGQSAKRPLRNPFVMFPEKSSVIVSRETADNLYSLCSGGRISADSFAQLFLIQKDVLQGGKITVISTAFREVVPSLARPQPAAFGPSPLRVRLSNWRKSLSELKKKAQRQKNVLMNGNALPPTANVIETDGNRIICYPGLLPIVVSPRSWSKNQRETEPQFQDKELQAVMKITENGNDTSTLFPSFSDDADDDCESDDGLGDELGALDEIEDELRKELEHAEVIIKGVVEAQQKLEAALHEVEKDDQAAPKTLSDGAQHQPSKRRVRFAAHNIEYIYNTETFESDDQTEKRTELQATFDEIYYVFEDLMDEVSYFCSKAFARKPRAVRGSAKVSTVY